jgi:hypothetical protein
MQRGILDSRGINTNDTHTQIFGSGRSEWLSRNAKAFLIICRCRFKTLKVPFRVMNDFVALFVVFVVVVVVASVVVPAD